PRRDGDLSQKSAMLSLRESLLTRSPSSTVGTFGGSSMMPWFPVRSWFQSSTARRANRTYRRSRHLALECLEERTLLSTALVRRLPVLSTHPQTPTQPDPSAYITGLYYDLLHRQPGAQEVAAWSAAMNGGMTRNQVASAFIGSAEYRTNEIVGDYRNILRREPEGGAVVNWLNAMNQGLNAQQL